MYCVYGKLLETIIQGEIVAPALLKDNYIFASPLWFMGLCSEAKMSKGRKLVVIMKAMFYIYLPLSVTFFPVALSTSSSVRNRAVS